MNENYLKQKRLNIWDVSNPILVLRNAQKYFNDPNIQLFLSTRPEKKYMMFDDKNNKWVHFGSMQHQDFTHHQDLKRKNNYIRRSSNIRGNWKNNKMSPNNLSIHLLWA